MATAVKKKEYVLVADLGKELHQRTKQAAVAAETTMSALAREALERYLPEVERRAGV